MGIPVSNSGLLEASKIDMRWGALRQRRKERPRGGRLPGARRPGPACCQGAARRHARRQTPPHPCAPRRRSHQEMDRLVTELEGIWRAFAFDGEGNPTGVEWLPVDHVGQALCSDLGYEDMPEFEDALKGGARVVGVGGGCRGVGARWGGGTLRQVGGAWGCMQRVRADPGAGARGAF